MLGSAAVPDGLISRLGKAIQLASRLHRLDLPQDEGGADNSAELLEPRFDPDFDRQARGIMEGTTVQTVEVQKERFAYWNLDTLFMVCDAEHGAFSVQLPSPKWDCAEPGAIDYAVGTDRARGRVAALCAPLLLTRCAAVLSTYNADAPLRGKMPFPRCVDAHTLPSPDAFSLIIERYRPGSDKRNCNIFFSDCSRCDFQARRSASPCSRHRFRRTWRPMRLPAYALSY